MLEAGYRGSITSRLDIDVELFYIRAKNYNVPVQSHPVIELDGTDTVHETPIISTNLPLELTQRGITVSVSYGSGELQVKPFMTLQQTRTKNYAPFINTPDDGLPGAEQNNIYSGIGKEAILKSTPAVFGGASVNYVLSSKINLNMSSYYYSAQTYYHLSNILFNDGIRGIDHINAKLLINANVLYEPVKGLHLFCTGKNILNDKSREFFRTDDIPFMLLAGVHYEL
jgi:iron complex outermembrane receptor protein